MKIISHGHSSTVVLKGLMPSRFPSISIIELDLLNYLYVVWWVYKLNIEHHAKKMFFINIMQ